MRRIVVVAIVVAMLMSPLSIAFDSSGSDIENSVTAYASDGVGIAIYNGADTYKFIGPGEINVPIGSKIWGLKTNVVDDALLLNGGKYTEGSLIDVNGVTTRYIFHTDNICIINLQINDAYKQSSIFDGWEKYDELFIKQVYCEPEEVFKLPLMTDFENWGETLSWINPVGKQFDEVDCSKSDLFEFLIKKDLVLYNVNFYENIDLQPCTKVLTRDFYDMPTVNSDNFAGWFYKDQDGKESEFKEGVVLQDNMNVYAKYYETSQNESEVKDTSPYHLLTNNGIKITDNEVIETVVASTVFVMLALATFVFVFKRH